VIGLLENYFLFIHLMIYFVEFSWETDDEGDFYSEQANGDLLDQDDDEGFLDLGLPKHLIEFYPTTTAEEVSVVGVVCDICLNEYKSDDKLRTIPCLHRFHCKCIDKWLKVEIFIFVEYIYIVSIFRKIQNVQCAEVIYENRNGIPTKSYGFFLLY
jgi:hypothetical protein